MMTTGITTINAYKTHYEILNYKKGACPQLERELSYFESSTHTIIKFYHIDELNDILYISRGFDDDKLKELLGRPITYKDDCNRRDRFIYSMKLQPRNDIQRESVRFLLGKGEYNYTSSLSQLVLALVGGGGKTYCTIAACSIFQTKMIVICHNRNIRDQWIDRIQEYTNIPNDSIYVMESTKDMNSLLSDRRRLTVCKTGIYLVCHRSLGNYMQTYGQDSLNILFNHLGIGIKIVDEVHKEYRNTINVDYFTNVWKTIYLSATFGLTGVAENALFQKCFDRVYKLKREVNANNVNDVVYIMQMFNSHANGIDVAGMFSKGKQSRFSKARYIEYQLDNGEILIWIEKWINYAIEKKFLTEKDQFLILSPKIESCDTICDFIRNKFPELKSCSHHTRNKVNSFDDYNIICATSGMVGTGTDIANLMGVILTEPMVSQVNNDQLIHRLMRGNDMRKRIFIDLVDWSIKHTVRAAQKRKDVIKQFVTQFVEINPYSRKNKSE